MSNNELGIILVGGLPGSGKTPHLEQLRSEGWRIFDDFQADAHDNSPHFRSSRRYSELIEAVRNGHKCVVSDVRIVCADYRSEAEQALRDDLGELSMEWRIFENDPDQCAENIRRDKHLRPQERRLAVLGEFSQKYSFPSGAVRLEVRRP